ncbi:MlaD family protein [Patulibacter sp. NPDC049589]|uniref:MlaD family protein n=1 Tax=Patulibacter sp. NPDC049589 TaxID=3154731 RepID=UPI00344190D2
MSRTKRSTLLKQAPAAGLAAVLMAGGIIVATSGDDGTYVVRAVMKDAAGLRKNGDVKVAGVAAGTISALELGSDDRAVVTMKLDDGAYPIGKGASAAVRPVNLLGEKYVDLDPGDLERPVSSGETIGIGRTSQPVELDDVLNMLDPGTRGRMRILVNEAGVALNGKGTDLNATIERLPRALDQTEKLVASFTADNARLKDAIAQGDRVVDAFHDGRDDLTDLVASAQRSLRVTADRRADLGQTVADVPATLSKLRTTLAKLQTTSTRLKPAALQIRRSAGPLSTTMGELPDFVKTAKPTLKSAERTAPTLGRLGRGATPVLKRLTPVASELERFSVTMKPLSRTLDHETNPLLRLIEGWGRTVQLSDAAGHVFRTDITVNQELLEHLLTRKFAKGPAASNQTTPTVLAPAPAPQSAPFPFAPRDNDAKNGGTGIFPTPLLEAPAPAPTVPAPAEPKPSTKADDTRQLLDYLLR